MDRLEAMELLLQAVELGSFSAVAREKGLPVSTVSRRIAELEAKLGTKLLLRTTRQLSLTDAGQSYVEAARRILEQVEQAEREAAGEYTIPKGELAITAPLCFGRLHLLPVVSDFLAQFPQITIRMLLSDRNIHLVEDHIDMATRIGRLPDSGLVATRIGTMRTVVCASPSLLARHGEPDHPEALRDLPCVAFDTPMPFPAWQFRDPASGKAFDVPVAPRLSVTTADASVMAACAGTGFTRLLHYQAEAAIEAGELKIVLEDFEPEPAPVHILHVARGQMPLKLRRFIDFAAPRLRDRLEAFA
ncbi:LysR family transcriptional regulator [Alteraurantiacibacter aquimixticola]|uniref:LysR family transcriptional regulator n=1 Tax=Alteraurantiacibacter aquimixticola TaxID=2489173 RepID=A0A4T3F269_9SPHN|nr:LysR family transcriptional regulator [Alteraurantiacibacter aquimixticola]TIX49505.1 LysR family transcriptional regulator [Alteraurantiacibacter aquimixticola]